MFTEAESVHHDHTTPAAILVQRTPSGTAKNGISLPKQACIVVMHIMRTWVQATVLMSGSQTYVEGTTIHVDFNILPSLMVLCV